MRQPLNDVKNRVKRWPYRPRQDEGGSGASGAKGKLQACAAGGKGKPDVNDEVMVHRSRLRNPGNREIPPARVGSVAKIS